MEYRDELDIAKKAEQMLTTALQNKTKSFAEHYNRASEDVSMKEAHAKSRVKRYGRKREGNQQVFMRSLAIRMARHGFVQHYGVDTIRAGSSRKSKSGKEYHYKPHAFQMRATPFITEAIQQSGVIDFVAENVAELRAKNFAEELIFSLSHLAKNR